MGRELAGIQCQDCNETFTVIESGEQTDPQDFSCEGRCD